VSEAIHASREGFSRAIDSEMLPREAERDGLVRRERLQVHTR
jgi:hypothetical protein